MEADSGVAGQPALTLGLVGGKIVEDDLNFLLRAALDEAVHEVEKLDTLGAPVVRCSWLRPLNARPLGSFG